MRKVYKKPMNNDGISGLTALVIIIIIGLLVWEFALPFIDENIQTPSSYFRPSEDELTGKWSIFNHKTGVVIDVHTAWANEHYYENDENYSVIINSNVPWSIFSPPYYFQIQIYSDSQLSSTFEQEVQYVSLYTDEFIFKLGLDLSGHIDYQIYARILDANKLDTGLLYSSYFLLGST